MTTGKDAASSRQSGGPKKVKPTTVEEYLAALVPDRRAELERIRTLVKELVPGLEETLSYGMPTLKYKGKALVYFTSAKKHLTFYPSSFAIEALAERLEPWSTTQHAVQYTLDASLPDELVAELVAVHVKAIDEDWKP